MSNDTKKIETALLSKNVNVNCEKCGTQQSVSTQPFLLPVGMHGDFEQSANVSALICTNCGHIDLFSDQILGV